MQRRICSIWVHLRCSLLSLSCFRALGSSHYCSCPPFCVSASPQGSTPTNTVSSSSSSSSLYIFTVQPGSFGPPLLMQRSRPTLVQKHSTLLPPTSYLLLLHLRSLMFLAFLYLLLPLPPPDSFRVFRWNPGGLRARSAELLYFISLHHVNLICIQESILNSCFSHRILGYSCSSI